MFDTINWIFSNQKAQVTFDYTTYSINNPSENGFSKHCGKRWKC